MSYTECLEKAGAKVIEYKETGSYQGSWGAICDYKNERILVTGSYGSCSGCDSFLAEFDFNPTPSEHEGKYYKEGNYWDKDDECTKEEYDELIKAIDERYALFAQSYLNSPYTKEDIERQLASYNEDEWFDEEEKELYEWAITFFD